MTTFKEVLNKNRRNIEMVAHHNSNINKDSYTTISSKDPWVLENEWDSYYKELIDAECEFGI